MSVELIPFLFPAFTASVTCSPPSVLACWNSQKPVANTFQNSTQRKKVNLLFVGLSMCSNMAFFFTKRLL